VSKYFLTTKRLGFRAWSEGDIHLALGLWGDPEVTKLIDARGQLTEEQVRERLLLEIATARSHGIQYWPIFLLGNDEHVGCCGLRPYDEPRGILELGVHLRPQHWGCGYATEASRAAMRVAFERLEVRGLFAGHNPKNGTSRHNLGKLGFQYTHDELYEPTGLEHPCYLLMAEEYWALSQVADERPSRDGHTEDH
jgi:[ribosomal protein S5]-alanine N-acetyltransferase